MLKDIYLRISDSRHHERQQHLSQLLAPKYRVIPIDDSSSAHLYEEAIKGKDKILALSQQISGYFPEMVLDFRISRVFDHRGKHCAWKIPSLASRPFTLTEAEYLPAIETGVQLILDTDIATGATRDLALRLFPGAMFFSPITLTPGQELIDVEDLLEERTWNLDGQKVSYLSTPDFFASRTRLPAYYHALISKALHG